VLPFFLELWMEYDLSHATYENVKLILMGSWMFFLFASQTKGFRLAEAIKYGKAGYVATGRGYVIEPGSFIGLYCVYAKSHIYTGFETFCLLVVYHIFSEAATWTAVWTLWFFAASMMLAPYMFNPQSLSLTTIGSSFEELLAWLSGHANKASKDHHGSWALWHENRLKMVRGSGFLAKVADHTRIALIRIVIFLAIAARLETSGKEAAYRLPLLLLSGCIMAAAQLVIYLLASENTLCSAPISGLKMIPHLAKVYRATVVAGVIVVYFYVLDVVVSPYCTFGWSGAGARMAVLHVFTGALFTTFWLQLLATLDVPKPKAPRTLFVRIKCAITAYADWWYFVMDTIVSGTLIFTLLLLGLLPLLRLQSLILFNREFAKVIAAKLRRAELLKRILS